LYGWENSEQPVAKIWIQKDHWNHPMSWVMCRHRISDSCSRICNWRQNGFFFAGSRRVAKENREREKTAKKRNEYCLESKGGE
jgi:hypothetical protein